MEMWLQTRYFQTINDDNIYFIVCLSMIALFFADSSKNL